MKVLGHFAYFLLPDDFEGGISDALRLLADYHEGAAVAKRECAEVLVPETGSQEWLDFREGLRHGKKHVGKMTLRHYKDGEWTRLGPEGDW